MTPTATSAIPQPNAKNATMAIYLMIKIDVSSKHAKRHIVWSVVDMGTVINASILIIL